MSNRTPSRSGTLSRPQLPDERHDFVEQYLLDDDLLDLHACRDGLHGGEEAREDELLGFEDRTATLLWCELIVTEWQTEMPRGLTQGSGKGTAFDLSSHQSGQ